MATTCPDAVRLKPVPEDCWGYTGSIQVVRELMQERRYPLALHCLHAAMRMLSHKS